MKALSTLNKGWMVVAAGFGINLALGVLYAWSVIARILIKPISEGGWGLSNVEASLPYALSIAMYALSMAVAGAAQDKYGPRKIATFGGILCGAGLLISSFASADNPLPMILGFGILTGLGVGVGYSCATPAALKWFPAEKTGLITGIVVAGFGLASAYIAPLANYLLRTTSIEATFRILGFAFLFLVVALAQLLNNPPEQCGAEDGGNKKSGDGVDDCEISVHPRDVIKTKDFYILLLTYGFAAFAGHMIIGHMAKISSLQVPDFTFAFLLVTVLAFGNAGGRIAAGISLDRLGKDSTMRIAFVGQAVMMGILAFTASTPLMMICALGVGFFYGANLAMFPSITSRMFGRKYLGANYGILFLSWGVGGVFGSMAAGLIVDAQGNYLIAYQIAAFLCVLAAVLTLFFSKK